MLRKIYTAIRVIFIGALVVSCANDDDARFMVDKPQSVVEQEEIDAYDALRTYVPRESNPGFKLGGAVSMSDYRGKGVMYRLLNNNFDEMTAGYGMKHGAVVKSDGTLDLDNVNEFLTSGSESGLTVYGHTLCWHSNQNAGYLNSLLAPLVLNAPPFANALDLSSLQGGSLDGWEYTTGGGDVQLMADGGMGEGKNAVKLVSGNSAEGTALRLSTPGISVGEAQEYEVLCYIKSDRPGEGSFTFEGLAENAPLKDWTGTGEASETFVTGVSWTEIRFRVSEFTSDTFQLHLNLGYEAGVTYYLDIDNFYVYDPQGEPVVNNLIANGDFEAGQPWGGWGNNVVIGITEDGQGINSQGKALSVYNPSVTGGFWEVQTSYTFAEPLQSGETYNLSFWVKGDAEGVIRPELQSPDYSSNGFPSVSVTKEWEHVELSVTATADRTRFIISYGEFAGTVFIDDVQLSNASVSGGSTTVVEKTPEEKTAITHAALEDWISRMVTNCAPYVKAWDVVNEPMDDGSPYELKSGIGKSDMKDDEFYWQDYLGQDYAVSAFKMARAYGNENDLLFINDYNLEYNLDKCKGLIAYVNYIEEQGALVDGIATQMHITINSDKEKIATMFELLAATGKIIKVSELDVAVKTSNPTEEQLKAQADMYRYVVDMYKQYIPADQRYGITVWGVTDSADNASWLPGDRQGLWNLDYTRKPAYASFAEGLQGL